ncbi:MAG: hypothetical protein ACYC7G_07560 [Rudaea sp.]
MELIGSYHASGYTVEAYFPDQATQDVWPIWVVRDGKVVGEFTTRIVVHSVYGMDHHVMVLLEAAAEAAIEEVARRERGYTEGFARAA